MSVKIMGMVFDTALEPNKKLVLLSLADRADNEGCNAYPSVARISKEASLSERTVQRILAEFREDGLIVETAPASAADRKPTTYRIDILKLASMARVSNCHQCQKPPQGVTNDELQGDTVMAPEPSLEPSLNHPNNPLPTVGDSAGSGKLTKDQQRKAHQRQQEEIAAQAGIQLRAVVPLGVPAVQMVMAYHHYLPGLPRCIVITNDRAKKLSARWKDCGEDANAWKHVLVDKIAPSAFLTGRAQARPGAEPFKATLDWIIGPENFVKIIEGKYVHGQAPDYSNVQ